MKKIIGILGIAVFSMAMFFSTNAMNSINGDLDLENLASLNTANAEGDICITCGYVSTDVCITINYKQYIGYRIIYSC